jgi:putative DNA primase/helicase
VIVPASAIKTAPVKWLWPDVIALGMINLFTGNPDQCKSLMIEDVVARASRGTPWLDGTNNPLGPIEALLMFTEDPAANVVVPRLVAADADLTRIHLLRHVQTGSGKEHGFALAHHMNELNACIEQNPGIRLIAIDPLSAHFGADKKLMEDQVVREVVNPLVRLAEEREIAVLNNSHLNKTQGLDPVQRVIGSMAIVAVHRMAWVFVPANNDQDEVERMVLPLKHNITGNAHGMRFSVKAVPVTLDEGTVSHQPRIVYTGNTNTTAEEALGMTTEQKTQLQHAIEILREELGSHEQKDGFPISQRIHHEVQDCSASLITKARKAIGVRSVKVGKRWQWILPGPQCETQSDTPALSGEAQISCASCAP